MAMGIVSRSAQWWRTNLTVGRDGDLLVGGVAEPETGASAETAARMMD